LEVDRIVAVQMVVLVEVLRLLLEPQEVLVWKGDRMEDPHQEDLEAKGLKIMLV
jgi:hypothetical protein